MKVCALTNSVTAGVLTLGLAVGLAASSCGPVAPPGQAPGATGPAPEPVAEPITGSEPSSEGQEADPTETGPTETASTGNPPPATGDDRTRCPLDTASGADAPETAGVKGQDRSLETIQKIITAHRGCVRRCYEKLQEKMPNLEGDMTITMVIKPKGELKSAEINRDRSDIFAPAVVDCSVEVLKKLEFGEHPKGKETTVNYPFNFQP